MKITDITPEQFERACRECRYDGTPTQEYRDTYTALSKLVGESPEIADIANRTIAAAKRGDMMSFSETEVVRTVLMLGVQRGIKLMEMIHAAESEVAVLERMFASL